MLPLPILLPLLALTPASASPVAFIVGLDPAKHGLYVPTAQGTFRCLDGSKVIPFKAINDDYCDCPDGSDEPGTSACPNSTFFCANEGHVPGKVISSRVADGICDPECCDGSDEPAGECPDVCEALGRETKAKEEAAAKIRKTGSKIRSSYIAFAQKEKKRLKAEITKQEAAVQVAKEELKKAEEKTETMEAAMGATIERRKASPLYKSLVAHRSLLSRLSTRRTDLETELSELRKIMDELVRSYNPNYQDMSVRAAARGYMELFYDGRVAPAEGGEGSTEPLVQKQKEDEDEVKQEELEALEKEDLDGLLVGWEDGTEGEGKGAVDELEAILFNLSNYIPDPLTESFDFLRSGLVYWLVKLGVIEKTTTLKPSSNANRSPASRDALHKAEETLKSAEAAFSSATASLGEMADKFGPEGEWKKLENSCIDKDLGEYTYELCWFGEAKQKSNKGGASNKLGSFKRWNYDDKAEKGTEQYYSKQLYDNGAKCWNGPNRSVKLEITCAKEAELFSVVEAEKCEYVFRATSPALCWPAKEEAEQAQVKDEL